MSSTALHASVDDHAADSSPQNPRARLPRRRRWWLLGLAVLLVAGAVAGSLALLTAVDEREPMLRLTRDVAWGEPVGPEDVESVPLPPQAREFAVPEDHEAQIVGQTATQHLHAGDVLSPRDVTDHTVPGPGQRVVGVRVEPGQFPARDLQPNDPVRVVSLGEESSVATDNAARPSGEAVSARVVDTSPPGSDGAITVDVLVPASRVATAEQAAAGQALITLLGPDAAPDSGAGR